MKRSSACFALALFLVTGLAGPTARAAANNAISVTMRFSDGTPMTNASISVYSTKRDANGNFVRDSYINGTSSGVTGVARVSDLADGTYLVGSSAATGYMWQQLNEPVSLSGGKTQSLTLQTGRFTLTMRHGDGSVFKSRGVTVYTVKQDANGGEIRGDYLTNGSTGDTGRVSFELTPGRYTFTMDAPGYTWPSLVRPFTSASGQNVDIQANLGRIDVVLHGPDGSLSRERNVSLYTTKLDANGDVVIGDYLTGDNTGAVGKVDFDLTPGIYALKYSLPTAQDVVVNDVPVVSGKLTSVDGQNVQPPPEAAPAPSTQPAPTPAPVAATPTDVSAAPQPEPGPATPAACTQPSAIGCGMAPGTPARAVVSAPDEVHTWRVSIGSPGTYVVTLTDLAADYDLHVYGSDNTTLVGDSTNDGTDDERIQFTADGPSEYFVYVNSPYGETSDSPYTLDVETAP